MTEEEVISLLGRLQLVHAETGPAYYSREVTHKISLVLISEDGLSTQTVIDTVQFDVPVACKCDSCTSSFY